MNELKIIQQYIRRKKNEKHKSWTGRKELFKQEFLCCITNKIYKIINLTKVKPNFFFTFSFQSWISPFFFSSSFFYFIFLGNIISTVLPTHSQYQFFFSFFFVHRRRNSILFGTRVFNIAESWHMKLSVKSTKIPIVLRKKVI